MSDPRRRAPAPSRRALRRAQFRRRRLAVLFVLLLVVLAVVAAVESVGGGGKSPATAGRSPGAGGSARPSSSPVAQSSSVTAASSLRAPSPSVTAVPTLSPTVPPTTVDPGLLPQTDAFPTSTSPRFEANMAALWNGIVANNVRIAQSGFFPESAYLRLKTVSDASADFQDRLIGEYALDIAAAHALLGAAPASAQFVGVDVAASYGHWVPPGVCSNDIGYFEVPNSRLVYRVGGQIDSLGIASMISWRGEWYVVHLGAVERAGTGGQVDDPEVGPGSPRYSSTC